MSATPTMEHEMARAELACESMCRTMGIGHDLERIVVLMVRSAFIDGWAAGHDSASRALRRAIEEHGT